MKIAQPSPLELQVLSVLWARGESTVRDVLNNMPDGRSRAYTTLLSVMQSLEEKGLVSRKTDAKAHLYKPKRTEKQVISPILKEMVNHIFRGSAGRMIEMTLDAVKLTECEKESVIVAAGEHKPRRR